MLDVEIPLLFILSIMLSIVSASRFQQSTNTEWQSHHFLIVFYHIFLSEEKKLFIRIQGISCLYLVTQLITFMGLLQVTLCQRGLFHRAEPGAIMLV